MPKKSKKGSKKKKKQIEEEEREEEEEQEPEEEEAEKEAEEEEPEEEEEKEGEEVEKEEEEEEEEEEPEEEEEEEEEKKEKKKKKGSGSKGKKGSKGKSDLEKIARPSMLAKIGIILGVAGIITLLLDILVGILNWIIPGVWCLSCLLWPVLALGFLAAIAAIVLGVMKLVMDKEGDKKQAFIAIGLGAAYFVLGVVWAIASVIINIVI